MVFSAGPAERRATAEGAWRCLRKTFDQAELFEALSTLMCVSIGIRPPPSTSHPKPVLARMCMQHEEFKSETVLL